MNILLIYPEFPDTFWSFKHAVQFISKRAANPPLGLVTVAAMLPVEWNLRLVDLNVSPLTDKHLAWADQAWIGAMAVQRKSVEHVVERCKQHGLTVVAGGPLFTGEWQAFPTIDHFILNEAELTLPPFLADMKTGTTRRVYETDEYADMSLTPLPRWDLLDLRSYDTMSIQFSRGCPFNCDFCNVTALLGHRPRTKSAEQLVTELDDLYQRGWRRKIFIVDDNFIGNRKVLKDSVLPSLIAWRAGKKGNQFLTEVSINLADDTQLTQMMVDAGFQSVFVGIETPNEDSLAECKKSQNKNRDLLASVKRLQRAGLQVMGGFIVGFDSDTETIFQRQIDFIQESGIVTAMVGLLQAPFGTQLYARMLAEGRLREEMSGDNTDGSSNIVPIMDPAVLAAGYRRLISTIYRPAAFFQRVKTLLMEFRPAKSAVNIEWNEIAAFLRIIWRVGLLGDGRLEFWRLFFWSLRNRPDLFPLAMTFAVYGYHFRKVSALQGLN